MNEGLGFAKFMPYPVDERLRGRRVPVYTARPRGGPAVVVLHGSTGATPAFFRFAYQIADAGFSVYAPVLSGKPGTAASLPARALAARRLASRQTVAWTRVLCRHLYGTEGTRAGIVGEGAAGLLALAALADGTVAAAADIAQSLPLGVTPALRRSTGLTTEQTAAVRTRLASGAAELYLLRFAGDPLAPAARYAEICSAFPAGVTANTKLRPPRPFTHSFIAGSSEPRAGNASTAALDDLIAFLRRRLR